MRTPRKAPGRSGHWAAITLAGSSCCGPTPTARRPSMPGPACGGRNRWATTRATPCSSKRLHLRVGGQAASHLASIVGPFVLADLPVVMWFPHLLPDPADPLLRLASAVVVDTRSIGPAPRRHRPRLPALLELANHQPVVDLSWVRLQPWRELLAGLFEPEHNRQFLPGVRLASVRGKPGPPHAGRVADVAAAICAPASSRWRTPSTSPSPSPPVYLGEEGKFEVTAGRPPESRVWRKRRSRVGSRTARGCPCPTTR